MIKNINFDRFVGDAWPTLQELEPFFLSPAGTEWSYDGGNDNWAIRVRGIDGTEHLIPYKTRVDINLTMWGHPKHGVLLHYAKFGGNHKQHLFSRGDMSRIQEWVRTLQGDLSPIGLYIPFARAWLAVKEFMETDGQLTKSIEWIRSEDLPPNTFPDPWEKPEVK